MKALHMFVEEVEQNAISSLVLLLDLRVLEITTSCHEAVDLIREPLDNVLGLDSLLPFLDSFFVLVLRWKHGVRDGNTGSVRGVDHGRVAGRGSLERGARLRGKVDDLSTPAEADNSPLLDVAVLAFDLLQDIWNALHRLWWSSGGGEELAEFLTLLLLHDY